MANSRYSGTTLVTTIFVLSTFTLAIVALRIWFRVTRRMFDRSDLLLLGGVVHYPYSIITPEFLLTIDLPAMRHDSEHRLLIASLELLVWKAQSQYTAGNTEFRKPRQNPVHQPHYCKTYHAALQTFALLFVSQHLLSIYWKDDPQHK